MSIVSATGASPDGKEEEGKDGKLDSRVTVIQSDYIIAFFSGIFSCHLANAANMPASFRSATLCVTVKSACQPPLP
jgi:hypothetical protein